MWPFPDVSRATFEKQKDLVEKIMQELGCKVLEIELPYENKTTHHFRDFEEEWISTRPVYQYKNAYYRIGEMLFANKPGIVLEYADTIEEVLNNVMDEMDPFPYDLSEEELALEVKYSLGIEPHPTQ